MLADTDVVEIVKTVAGVVTTIGVPYVAVLLVKQQIAAKKVEATLEKTTAKQTGQLTDIHQLVNSEHEVSLQTSAVLARRLADKPDAMPADVDFAEQAERRLAEHRQRQAAVNARTSAEANEKKGAP